MDIKDALFGLKFDRDHGDADGTTVVAIESLKLSIEALEKQMPALSEQQGLDCLNGDWAVQCPLCHCRVSGSRRVPKYCPECGQALCWA